MDKKEFSLRQWFFSQTFTNQVFFSGVAISILAGFVFGFYLTGVLIVYSLLFTGLATVYEFVKKRFISK